MKKNVRKVHVDGMEWHYVVSEVGNCRIFPPHSKSVIAEAHFDEMPEDTPDKGSLNCDGTRDFSYTHVGWRPGRIKAFIEQVLLDSWKDGSWIAAGKPILDPRNARVRHSMASAMMGKWAKIIGKEWNVASKLIRGEQASK